MTDDLHSPLATALRERVRDEHPDLDELVRVSTADGTRLRRQRRAASALVVVAGTAAASACVLLLSGTGGRPTGESGIATQPTSTINEAQLAHRLERLAEKARGNPGTESAPLRVTARGWSCSEPADEKMGCRQGAAVVTVTWRPAAERTDYLDPGKADVVTGVHTFVSERHGRWFATVEPGIDTTQAEVDEVGAGIAWIG